MTHSHDLIETRREKLNVLRSNGTDPFQTNCEQTHTSVQAKTLYCEEEQQDGPTVKVAGRIIAFRLMGKAAFVKLLDRDGQIQIYFKQNELGEANYAAFKRLDLGDIIGISGPLFRTSTGEVTVRAQAYTLVAKALRPLPEKWSGLTDNEQIYRQRYLDLIVNKPSRQRFILRSRIIAAIRQFLDARGFLECETPVLQHEAGGAAARPFVTHLNAQDRDCFLRIALELHLKRLLVGGLERVYEIGRVFRNEGLSRRHNPEFTMLEAYQAYTDYRGMMTLVYDLIQMLCRDVLGKTQIEQPNGTIIELSGPWREASYRELIIEQTEDADWFHRSKQEKLARCTALGIAVDPQTEDFAITQQLFEKKVEPGLIQPTFVTHLPKALCPLAKANPDDPTLLDVFELCINGQEIAPAYSEQNDPESQRRSFQEQVGDEIQNLDEDFLTALEHGMPPAGGLGLGIDRLCILLTGAANIRDVILFPQLKQVKG